ncbi:hypothetical protein Micbo1qcDRAFT_201247 [Microdochium bolleyi]|uniref:Uncharacterized protein n=1 Tax=Microdochium bolleyi TaxID=196109 RepID=A0A136JFH1_9PEZI|nr:hypothetical protein Micbo1qcDRAFT_201247 [Microdochium bolleyi]
MAVFAYRRVVSVAAATANTASVLLAVPVIAVAIAPHPVGYRTSVTGRVGDLGARMPGSLERVHLNPCNGSAGALYDICDGPYSFIRCLGQDPLLVVDCVPKPEHQCWVNPEDGKATCGKPAGIVQCASGSGSSAEEWNGDVAQ